MTLMEMLAAPGEILDSHRGVITEKYFMKHSMFCPRHTCILNIVELSDHETIYLFDFSRKEILFTANHSSQWPFALTSYISKYKAQQVDEE